MSATAPVRPPVSNRGVTTPPNPTTPLGIKAQAFRLDWYAATFEGVEDDRLSMDLALALGGLLRPAAGRTGYATAIAVEVGGDVAATVYVRPDDVHVQSTGSWASVVAPVLRNLHPDHRVARLDSALDFQGSFEEFDRFAVEFAERRGMKYRLITNSEGGATRYLGSPTSEVMLRLYKKSEQWASLHPSRAQEVPQGVLRAELQVRPGKRAGKEAAARLSAADVWGLSKWATDFARDLLAFEPERTVVRFHRSSDWERALHFLGLQYGPKCAERAGAAGTAEVRAQVLRALGLEET